MSKSDSETKIYFKFLGTLALLFAGLCIFIILANWIIADKTHPFDDQVRRLHTDFLEGRVDDIRNTEVIVLGDSTAARALIPTSLTDKSAFSLMINGGSAVDAYYVLKRVYDLGSRPKCVVFMTSYGAYGNHLREKLWQTTIRQFLVPPSDIADYFETTSKMNQPPGSEIFLPWAKLRISAAPILRYLEWDTLHRAIFKPYETFTHSSRSYRMTRLGKGSNPVLAGSIWNGPEFNGPLQDYLKKPFKSEEVLDFYLRRMLDLAGEKKSKVLVLMAPVAETLRTPEAEAWIASAEAHVDQLLESRSHVINRFRTKWMDPSDFSDGTHLVESAGRQYSENLRSTIDECINRGTAP